MTRTYVIIRHMKRTTIFLDERLEHDLKSVARRQGRPLASVVREAMADYVAKALDDTPRLGFVAAGRSGRADTAETHEDVLWSALTPHGDAPAAKARAKKPAKRAARPPARKG